MTTGYEYLKRFRHISSHFERINLIAIYLENENIPYVIDCYEGIHKNIYIHFKGKTDENIVFLAHHDIKNPKSQNCQDNTASVCNLLHLCNLLKVFSNLEKGVFIVFTDEEEKVDFKNSGAARLAQCYKEELFGFKNIEHFFNLELTGRGKIVWADTQDKYSSKLPHTKLVDTPFNDSTILRYHGIDDTTCIGIFDDADYLEVYNKGTCDLWKLCHTEEDTFDKIVEEDMTSFVEEILFKLLELTKAVVYTC
jgi:hypothetical protein